MNTPSYIVISDILIKNYKSICNQMKECKVAYSTKANPSETVINILEREAANFEICSIKELELMNKLKIGAERFYCGLPVMKKEWIEIFYEKGCRNFIFDSSEQLMDYMKYAPEARYILRIKIDDISQNAIGYGMKIDEVYNQDFDPIIGLHFHISDHSNMDTTYAAISRVREILSLHPKIEVVNIGGSYKLLESDEYSKLNQKIFELKRDFNVDVYCEPGAAIVDSAVYALVKCVRVVEVCDGIYDVYIDGGISSGMMRKPDVIENVVRNGDTKRRVYRFFDTTSIKKLLFQCRLNFMIDKNDILCFKDYGAYTYCYSNIFHSQPIPDVYCVEREEKIGEFIQKFSEAEE